MRAMPAERISPTYRMAMTVATPFVRWWGRLQVDGLDAVPEHGPVLVAGNHDSYWDPVAVGVAALGRRQIRALAKDSLWKFPGLAPVLDGMGQIPIKRGSGDAAAMDRAIAELRAGACIGIFPEGTRSLGRELRARSGFGRLHEAVPEAEVVLVSIRGTVDITRGPAHRPRVSVRFFRPAAGARVDGESHAEQAARFLAEIRSEAPISIAGRKRRAAAAAPTGE
jgi:1-acyl-sn-glycerol-3-phosphate acyltransferase